jgi:2,3,4,5-tetrahydropyridine-2-carboxylate N-succinyltransferase
MTEITAADLKTEIEAAWAARDGVSVATQGPVRTAVRETLNLLDAGKLRVAERAADGAWSVNQWVKQAILLSFRLNANELMRVPTLGNYWDKVPNKFDGWEAAAVRSRRLPRRAGRDRPPRRLYRQERHPDAVVREHRRLCR